MQTEIEAVFNVAESYAAHGSVLFAYALNTLGDREEAEDCVRETFVRAWSRNDEHTSPPGSVRTWLFGISRHLITDSLQERAAHPDPTNSRGVDLAPGQDAASKQGAGAKEQSVFEQQAASANPAVPEQQAAPKQAAAEQTAEDPAVAERLLLCESLATLTPDQREVLSAVQLDGRSYQELSETTGVPIPILRMRMYEGLKALRATLGSDSPVPRD
ncbi:RNA polymerase sigma factor [Nesterenkonia jeotgali]|uniref:RNA polymerase sigma-70 factor (ECF subfamily) n=1 Tax=Nesterenkonia jeotgali TaxID=317018 RepID=A0A839FK82_9MICC|nr:sigma-70 family RNA polymerase sigma factor [Nesterenkonia jeotgali]MBA8922258.1 RNA polymerase sigma-70 factor (ECF subfamily) [Nesterenkonia jeotgali]